MGFRHKHILSADQFSREDLDVIFDLAEKCQDWFEGGAWHSGFDPRSSEGKYGLSAPYDFTMASLFDEASTRTRFSFELAHQKLGGIILSAPIGTTSEIKGESLQDTVKTASQLADVICLRRPDKNAAELAAQFSDVPVINCGDGGNEHPTQALLDLYTIRREKGKIDGLEFLFFGDNRHARTVRSLRTLLMLYDVKVETELSYQFSVEPNDRPWNDKLKDCDVIYITRAQRERWPDNSTYKMKNITFSFAELERMKKDAIVLHPGPRNSEMNSQIDIDPRVAIWRQVKNGLYVRMALLKLLLGHT